MALYVKSVARTPRLVPSPSWKTPLAFTCAWLTEASPSATSRRINVLHGVLLWRAKVPADWGATGRAFPRSSSAFSWKAAVAHRAAR